MSADRSFKLYSLRALGRADLPPSVESPAGTFLHTQTIKHDFFAATGFYATASGQKAVLKMGRTTSFYGLPLQWIGRALCSREVRFYTSLADLPNIPPVLARVGKTGFLHAYVEGHPLSKHRPIPDTFFADLHSLFQTLHSRNIAYVDTNKPENILQGDDGRPHLIDFQISWDLRSHLGNNPLTRWWLHTCQRGDTYHLLKHQRRLRPDQMTPAQIASSRRTSLPIRIHRIITKPYFIIRRALFKFLQKRGWLLAEGSK